MHQEHERDLRAVGGSPRGVYWCVLVLSTLVSGWLLALPTGLVPPPGAGSTLSDAGRVGAGVAGVLWAVVTVTFYRNYLRAPWSDDERVTVETVDGERAVVLAWRTTFHRQPLLVAAVVAFLAVQLTVVFAVNGESFWWVPLVVVAPFVLAVPDKVLELRRPLRLVLSPRGIGVSGFAGDDWLDWADVDQLEIDHVEQWAVVRARGSERAASWRHRGRRRLLTPRRGPDLCVEVPGPAFPVDARAVLLALEHYRSVPRARAELAGEAGRLRLLGRPPRRTEGPPGAS